MKTAKVLAKKLKTPSDVQAFLRSMPYNREVRGETQRSAEKALAAGTAHCCEAALLAASILEEHGYPPQVLVLDSIDGLCHVLFVFRRAGRWGAIGRSRDEGLHGRSAVFRSLRHLVWSYFEPYVDKTGCICAYGVTNLDESGCDWRESDRNLWRLEKFLTNLPMKKLRYSQARYKRLHRKFLTNGPVTPKKHWW